MNTRIPILAECSIWTIVHELKYEIFIIDYCDRLKPTLVNVYNIVIIINNYRNTAPHSQVTVAGFVYTYVYVYIYLLYTLLFIILYFKRCRLYDPLHIVSIRFVYNSLKRFCQLYIHYIPNNGHLSESTDLSVTIPANEMYSVKLKSKIRYISLFTRII